MHFWLRGGLVAQDYRIVNIILHTIVCVLMLPVLNVLLGSKGNSIAFYSTALFAVHPVHTEAVSINHEIHAVRERRSLMLIYSNVQVAGIVGRAELLCALFMWFSILLYNYSICAERLLYRWTSLCGCITSIAVSMLCKETGITAIVRNEQFLHIKGYY